MPVKQKNKRGRPLRVPEADRFLVEHFNGFLLWGYRQIAKELRVSERTVSNWIQKYSLPVRYAPSGRIYAYKFQIHQFLHYFEIFREGYRAGKSTEQIKAEILQQEANLRSKNKVACPHCGQQFSG